jgi:hypothetical protein
VAVYLCSKPSVSEAARRWRDIERKTRMHAPSRDGKPTQLAGRPETPGGKKHEIADSSKPAGENGGGGMEQAESSRRAEGGQMGRGVQARGRAQF